jgi:hypothetical protein
MASADEEEYAAICARLGQSESDWLSFHEAIELICLRLNVSGGKAIAELERARASREIRIWPLKPPVLFDDSWTVDYVEEAFGRFENRDLYFRRDDLECWLNSQAAKPTNTEITSTLEAKPASAEIIPTIEARPPKAEIIPPTARGRGSTYNWPAVREFVFEQMDYHGDFHAADKEWSCQADLERAIGDYVEQQQGLRPTESTLRLHAARFYKEWKGR